MPSRIRWRQYAAAAALLVSAPALAVAADTGAVEQLTANQVGVNEAGRQSQQRIDSLDQQKRELLREYRNVTAELDRRSKYNRQLQKQVDAQKASIEDIQSQLEAIAVTERNIVPFMNRMIDELERFVRLDLPFQREHRLGRVDDLRGLMSQPDVTNARRYRAILDAYQQEVEYGRTIGTYRAEVTVDGDQRTVELFRLGRLLLAYQTLDRRQYGYWDADSGEWSRLPARFHDQVEQGIRIAKEQMAPEMLILPVAAPEEH